MATDTSSPRGRSSEVPTTSGSSCRRSSTRWVRTRRSARASTTRRVDGRRGADRLPRRRRHAHREALRRRHAAGAVHALARRGLIWLLGWGSPGPRRAEDRRRHGPVAVVAVRMIVVGDLGQSGGETSPGGSPIMGWSKSSGSWGSQLVMVMRAFRIGRWCRSIHFGGIQTGRPSVLILHCQPRWANWWW